MQVVANELQPLFAETASVGFVLVPFVEEHGAWK